MAYSRTDMIDTSAAFAPTATVRTVAKSNARVFMIWLFIGAILVPVIFDVGLFAIPPYRLILLISLVPCGVLLLMGRLGKIVATDIFVLAFSAWVVVAIVANHGVVAQYQFIGFTVIDTAGAYLLGRTIVRCTAEFRTMVTVYFWSLAVMLPFAIIETQTGDPMIISFLRSFVRTRMIVDHEIRFGLERAQVTFEHPILYGVYAASGMGILAFTMGHIFSLPKAIFMVFILVVATICSMSSGAFLTLMVQVCFLFYELIMRPNSWRWKALAAAFLLSFIAVDLISERTPFHVFISYLTLNSNSGFYRTFIFEFGIQNVAQSPIFGIGLKDWFRPRWMSPTVDNFWLLLSMRYGVPGFCLFFAICLSLIWKLSRLQLPPLESAMRAGVLVSMGGVMLAAATVSLWAGIYVWFMFMLGASIWMMGEVRQPAGGHDPGETVSKNPARHERVYTRFPSAK